MPKGRRLRKGRQPPTPNDVQTYVLSSHAPNAKHPANSSVSVNGSPITLSKNQNNENLESHVSKNSQQKPNKKVRRGKRNKNILKNFRVYYANLRGLSSKLSSLKECIENYKPHLFCLTETKLDTDVKVEIEGYQLYHKNKKKGEGGIIIGVSEVIQHLTVEIERQDEDFESLWILLSNEVTKIRIGCIYAPQESRTSKKVYETMYRHIKNHFLEAKKKDEKILVTGDFNCKIGNIIKDNKEEVTKSGRLMRDMVLKQGMKILNSNPRCKGKWTRIEGMHKSIIDYFVVDEEDETNLISMEIDEEKLITPYTITNERMIPSDHCAITATFNWIVQATPRDPTPNTLNINRNSLDKFHRMTNGVRLRETIKQEDTLQQKYDAWQVRLGKIMDISFKSTRQRRKSNKIPHIRRLMTQRRTMKKEIARIKTEEGKIQAINECKELENKIRSEKHRMINNNITREVQRIEEGGGIESGAFWEFKKKMDGNKKIELPSAIIGKDKTIKTSKEEIKEEFRQFYNELFTQQQISDKLSREVLETKMRHIERNAKTRSSRVKITTGEVEEQMKKLKNKTTMDKQGLSNVIIKNGGQDFIESTATLYREIDEKIEQPKQWREMIINSIYKNKGDRKDLENRRGLFITDCMSKLYDKIKMKRNMDKLEQGISKYQVGGMRGKSTVDHIMTLNAVIDYNRYIGKETYIIFADAYKCFDKLNLQDCVCDISDIIGIEEAYELYNMNRRGKATLKTPVGTVENIVADNIVRQGTIPGPKMCDVNTDQINNIGRKCYTYIGPRVRIETLTFVDDIQNASSHVGGVMRTTSNLQTFEKNKGYTFSIDKKKTAILVIGKKKKKNYDIDVKVKNGKVVSTEEYKYLGNWYNEEGDHTLALAKKKEKIGYLIQQIKFYGNEFKIGKYAMSTRIKIYISTVAKTIYHHIEAWSNITKKDWEELELIQKRIVTGMCEMMRSTPYQGLIAELGIWPAEQQIQYKQVMLLHNIITSKKRRLIKEIVEDQIEHPWDGCWIEEINKTCNTYNIEIDKVRTWTKEECKKVIKGKIKEKIEHDLQVSKHDRTKLRFIENTDRKKYIEELEYNDCVTVLKLRLNMAETKCNFKGNYPNNKNCEICKEDLDTTEHLLKCKAGEPRLNLDISQPNETLSKYIKHVIKRREDLGFAIKFGIEE